MKRIEVEEAAGWLREREEFLILTHIRPDGDALGSGGALCAMLRKAGKHAAMLRNPGTTSTYADYVESYWAQEGEQFAHIVSVDTATEGQFFTEAEPYKGKTELCFDHHPSNSGYAQLLCLHETSASCGEVLLQLCPYFCELDDEIASLLYVAVSTDTGCFVYGSTGPETHEAAAELLRHSTRYREINKRCFRTKSFKRLKLESMLTESLELYQDGTIAVASITQAMMEQVGAGENDAEDLAAFAGQVEGVHIAVTLRELIPGRRTKISLRTEHYLDASATCALLGGGGHVAAAGATVDMDLPATKEAILQAIYTIQGRQ